MRCVWILLLLGVTGVTLMAQSPVKNPRAVVFTCPDHDRDDGHEVDIVNSAGTVIHTLQGGDPPADANGEVTIAINVQPIAFGDYTIIVRAVAGPLRSVNSAPSAVWQRVPGAPSQPGVR